MKTEIEVSNLAAVETIKLIEEYTSQGGVGFDDDALMEMYRALGNADRIVILDEPGEKPVQLKD